MIDNEHDDDGNSWRAIMLLMDCGDHVSFSRWLCRCCFEQNSFQNRPMNGLFAGAVSRPSACLPHKPVINFRCSRSAIRQYPVKLMLFLTCTLERTLNSVRHYAAVRSRVHTQIHSRSLWLHSRSLWLHSIVVAGYWLSTWNTRHAIVM